tara:strand:+ start:485 stop:1186 length:702 start_codon:yes stop_codon:yes gene_type:complete
MQILAVIPARFNSTRFPGKPLAKILGKSMIQRVYEQACKCKLLSKIIVATENQQIYEHVHDFGGEAMMTSSMHESGTDRCNEVVQKLTNNYNSIIINIQGDEPFINPQQITELINVFDEKETQIATLAKEINNHEILQDVNSPKVIFNNKGIAINFFREINPKTKLTCYKHIGIYGFKKSILSKICLLPQSENEKKEKLEQLRWLDNGYKIKIGITKIESLSVDTPDDIKQFK